MAIVIIGAAIGGLLVAIGLLIREFLPKDKGTTEGLKEVSGKSISKLKEKTEQGRGVVSVASRILDASDQFIKTLDLPPDMAKRSDEFISVLRGPTETARRILNNPSLGSLLSLVSPIGINILDQSKGGYTYVITEDRDQPFQVNQQIVDAAQKIVAGKSFPEEKARAIFDWFEKNIAYGKSARKHHKKGYRHSAEVFTDKEGVCGEMAVLYVAMARAVGLESNYVSVDVDYKGENVCHACAAVKLVGKFILVDPAYHTFDILHRKFSILNDIQAIPHFKSMRVN